MRVIRNLNYIKHDVKWKYTLGPESYETKDTPRRVEQIVAALEKDDAFTLELSHEFPTSEISRIHPYHDFIKTVAESTNEGDEIYPDLFPGDGVRIQRKVHPLWGGAWCTDAVTPISCHTYDVARGSAEVAMTAAEMVRDEKATEVYALCRPSGHHAGPRVFGGYCYFNNAALAAEMLIHNGPVAVLDIDYHHGNGTQEFFEERNDVFTCSIHADPDFEYPYFWGYADERGIGQGEGSNLNLPLPKGTNNDQFLDAVTQARKAIQDFGAEFLVISAGFDTHIEDPIGGFQVTTDGYKAVAETLGEMGLPTVICQEGGYNTDVLGNCVAEFLRGFESAR